MRTLALCLVVACSHPPPPKPPSAELPITKFSDVDNEWVTSDDLDWSYMLVISGDDFMLTVDRGKLGRCIEHATAKPDAKPPRFELAVALDECHRDRAPGPIFVTFPSFTNTSLTVDMTDGAEHEHHVFTLMPHPVSM